MVDQSREAGARTSRRITFSQVMSPDRHGWPRHGAFSIEGAEEVSPPVFSLEAAREMIAPAFKDGFGREEDVADLERSYATASLPGKRSRYDRVVRRFWGQNPRLAQKLISQYSGTRAPDEGSGPARFEACTNGQYCKSRDCGRYAAHGALFSTNVSAQIDTTVFTAEGAMDSLNLGVENGLFLADELPTIQRQMVNAGLQRTEATERAQRLMTAGLDDDDLRTMLNLTFGIADGGRPARFVPCSDGSSRHFHLAALNDIRVMHDAPAGTAFDAAYLVDVGLKTGLLVEHDAQRLKDEIPQLGLPAGDEVNSLYGTAEGKTLRVVEVYVLAPR